MRLINRVQELTSLENRWQSHKPEFIVIYGKRRVGKTSIIKEFIKQKSGVYFLADQRNEREQLLELGSLIGKTFDNEILSRNGFIDWLEVFTFLEKNVKERFLFAIDEYPFLVDGHKELSSLFQKGWDEHLSKNKNIFLILCGSNIGMMEDETLSHKSPLFGRRTGQILVKPLSFYHSTEFFPSLNFLEAFSFYAIAGGMPAYLKEIDKAKSLRGNIQSIYDPSSYLYNEVEFLLQEELREPQHYLAILKAIAYGKRKFSEIVNDTQLDATLVNKYLTILQKLFFVTKEFPVTEDKPYKSKKGLYTLSDNFIRFWFQFIYPYKSQIEIGNIDDILAGFKDKFTILESIVYENTASEIIRNTISEQFYQWGRWWDNNNEIDIVALNNDTSTILFSEVKWSNKKVGTNIYLNLKEKSKFVEWNKSNRKELFCLCSKSGFTEAMIDIAQTEKVMLIEQDKLILQ